MVSNEGLRVKTRQGCGAAVLQDGRHESGFVLRQTAIIYEMGGTRRVQICLSAVTATTVVLGRWRSR